MAVPVLGGGAHPPLDDVAHIVQLALTPVFLLSGVGTLLNVFNTRLARVSDHSEHVADLLEAGPSAADAARLNAHLWRLRRRVFALDAAIALGGVGGAATCAAAFALFVGALRDSAVASWLVVLFGLALVCVIGSLVAFLADSVLAWHGLRTEGPLPRPQHVAKAS